MAWIKLSCKYCFFYEITFLKHDLMHLVSVCFVLLFWFALYLGHHWRHGNTILKKPTNLKSHVSILRHIFWIQLFHLRLLFQSQDNSSLTLDCIGTHQVFLTLHHLKGITWDVLMELDFFQWVGSFWDISWETYLTCQ